MYLLFKDYFIDQLSVEIILNHLSGNFITCMTNITINNNFKIQNTSVIPSVSRRTPVSSSSPDNTKQTLDFVPDPLLNPV